MSSIPRRKLSTLPAPARRMRCTRHSSNWTSFSPPWERASDGHEVVDLERAGNRSASAGQHVEGRTVATAAGDLRAVAQHDDEVAVEHRLQLADAIGVDDRRA